MRILVMVAFLVACDDRPSGPTPEPETGTFKNPILQSAPDPWVIQHGDYYYVTYTTGQSLKLLRTSEMSELANAEVRTIWTPPASGPNSKNIWAPELHFVNNKWYFYYAADDGANENHRIFVLENENADPFQGTWVDRGELDLPDDRWAIDGTIATMQGELYFLWSGWEGDVNVEQNIYICKMSDALTASGSRIRISKPTLSWEVHGSPPAINEAPQWLIRDDKIFITYSASGCWTDQYSIGLLSASASANLLDPSSWEKAASPIFTTNAASLAYGPGHNSFFTSKDGTEDWLTYHANVEANDGCGNERSMRMQRFTWENGRPVLGQPVPVGASLAVPAGEE